MKKRLRELLLCSLVFSTPYWASATHIFGGNFGMKPLPQKGFYQISLTLFFDIESSALISNSEKVAECSIQSVANGNIIKTFTMSRVRFEPLAYKNAVCVQQGKLRTATGYFLHELFLDPAIFNDPKGYLLVYSNCCRNNTITNIQDPITAEEVVSLQFPAITQNGVEFRNSSPDFGVPNGDYICINKPFDFNSKATDADGDELRYSLVTPYRRLGRSGGFDEVKWATGISLASVIPGPRPPVIHPRTGLMSLTANRLGLYVFTVLVEEYRGGKRIGYVRRDFQLPVVDCQRSTLEVPLVYDATKPNQPVQEVELCEGAEITLVTAEKKDYAYQWQQDNLNLSGANATSLRVTQPGDYRVIVSSPLTCIGDTNSLTISVKNAPSPTVQLNPSDTLRFCADGNGVLRVTDSSTYQYKWYRNGEIVAGQVTSLLTVQSAGTYIARVTTQLRPNCSVSAWDTVQVVVVDRPLAKISADRTAFCLGDSLLLKGSQTAQQAGEWYYNDQLTIPSSSTLYAKWEGAYRLKVIEGSCSSLSEPMNVSLQAPPVITFDSLGQVCFNSSGVVPLRAMPSGGVFIGKGIAGNSLIITEIGVGSHTVSYEFKDPATGCIGRQTRSLVVLPLPEINLPASQSVALGENVTLKPQTKDPMNEQFQWSPAEGLDDPFSPTPIASVQQNMTYTLRVTDKNGCVNQAATRLVFSNIILVPDAFSPNGDGVNDRLEIKKNGDFATLEMFIYNRWGELLFHVKDAYQNSWDGMYRDQRVQAGVYSYVVQNQEKGIKQAGRLWVLY